jgi:hypothetical protein
LPWLLMSHPIDRSMDSGKPAIALYDSRSGAALASVSNARCCGVGRQHYGIDLPGPASNALPEPRPIASECSFARKYWSNPISNHHVVASAARSRRVFLCRSGRARKNAEANTHAVTMSCLPLHPMEPAEGLEPERPVSIGLGL